MTPEQRTARALIAAKAQWAKEDPASNAARRHAGLRAKFEHAPPPKTLADRHLFADFRKLRRDIGCELAMSYLVPISYVVDILGLIGGCLLTVLACVGRQRAKWTAEGSKEANLAGSLRENTETGKRNTEEIGRQSTELREFRAELNGHDERLRRIEMILMRRGG
jgi:hypothetical protein